MSQLILNIKNKSKLPFLKELLKRMEFVDVIDVKAARKEKALLDIEESIEFVKQYKKGNSKAKSFSQLLDELKLVPTPPFERELKRLSKKYPLSRKIYPYLAMSFYNILC